MNVRHRAWLAAKPGKGRDRRSRAEQFRLDEEKGHDRPQLELPPIGFGAQVVDYLFEVGPSTGGEIISFQEIAAWSDLTGVVVDAWEAGMIRQLSGAYLAEYDAASDPDRAPPTGKVNRSSGAAAEAMVLKMMAQYDPAPGQGPKPDPSAGLEVPRQSTRGSDGRGRKPGRFTTQRGEA